MHNGHSVKTDLHCIPLPHSNTMALVEVGNKMQNGQIEVTQPDELMQANLQLSSVLRALKRVGSLALQNHCCIY